VPFELVPFELFELLPVLFPSVPLELVLSLGLDELEVPLTLVQEGSALPSPNAHISALVQLAVHSGVHRGPPT
jgi:hypothetical protein